MPAGRVDGVIRDLGTAARVGVGLVALFCAVALTGWIFGIPALTSIVPGWARMSVPTIIGFLLCCIGIQSLLQPPSEHRWAMLRQGAAAIVVLIALYALLGWLAPGLFPFADPVVLKGGYLFGSRMGSVAPATAFNFLLAALALVQGSSPRQRHLFASLVALGLVVTALDLIGYAFGVRALYKVIPFTAMSLPTALAFALIFSSALFARPTDGWFARIVANDSGGELARRLLPPIILIPVLLSGMMVQAERIELFDAPFGFAIVTVATTVILSFVIYLVSLWLGRRDVELKAEMDLRREAQDKLRMQLDRLNLLNQITRAIGERLDLPSIFQVVARSLEDKLPVDFACVCLYDEAGSALTVSHVGARSRSIARDMAMPDRCPIEIDGNGLSRCVRGQLVYEADISEVPFAFARKLSKGGLRALVFSPLKFDNKVFGVLTVARRRPSSFSSTECEFLRQLADNIGLAAHQTHLHGLLQQAYDDLRQTQKAVMQQERLHALGQMASGIAHDINNAISPVSLYTQSLLESEPDITPRVRNYLEIVGRVVNDVAATIARMRDFYRTQKPNEQLSPVDLNKLVGQIIELTRARWNDMPLQRGVTIKVKRELDPSLPAVPGHETEIREALTNLIFNGVDAMPEGGTLTIRTRVADGSGPVSSVPRVLLEVSDSGVGMDEEAKRRCLEPFFTTKGERGTGLGLAMVYGMAQRHEAKIDIDSTKGSGTTIRLSFPVAEGAAAGAAVPKAIRVPPLHILLIDDDPFILDSLEMVLSEDGHTVSTAEGGKAGIEMFRAALNDTPYSVVITDLGMPAMDGNEVARTIKSIAGSTPVILLTGWGQRMGGIDGTPPHIDMIVDKPPQLPDLRQALLACATRGIAA